MLRVLTLIGLILTVIVDFSTSYSLLPDSSDSDISLPTNRNRKAGNSDSISSTRMIPARFDHVYKNFVTNQQEYIFSYTYQETVNKTVAVRIQVSSNNASADYPVLFVVRQERSILSWQVPLFLQNVYDYYTVSRTLCPVQRHYKQQTETKTIFVDVSTSSNASVGFTMVATLLSNFELTTAEPYTFEVSPSEPKYFQYEFPPHLDSVVVRVTSVDDNCTVVSVQDPHCPIYDLDRNVQFTGTYQTMTRSAALTLQKSSYPDGIFYIVFVVKPLDYECSLIQTIQQAPGHGNELYNRRKNLTVVINPTISVDEYYKAVFGSVVFFLVFYVISVIISLIYYCRDRMRGVNELGHATGLERVDTPIHNDLPETSQYGATSPTAGGEVWERLSNTIQFSKKRAQFERDANGIPHRIPPPRDADDSSVDEEIDMLHDLDDKNVRRTKAYLYVADLARKDRKVLSRKYKLYYWNLLTIAIFYGLPVIQLVITYQKVLHVTGDEDICYYNFLCAHPLGVLRAFNNVFSNVGYIMLGLLFLGLVWRRDLMHMKAVEMHDRYEQYYGIPQHYGLFYAMGIALTMEGIMSGCYHVCPSYTNFQFDTSFMYMIALLCMLKIYQIRHPDINATAHQAYFALAIIIFIAVIGVVYDSWYFWVFFFVVDVVSTLLISAQIYYMGRWKLDAGLFKRIYLMFRTDCPTCAPPMYMDRMILLIIVNLVNFAFALYGLLTQPKDFSSFLLAILIVNLMLYVAFYIIMKLRVGERIPFLSCFYILIACVVWGFAMYFFMAKLTSWEYSPAESKNGNQDCLLLDFYDAHDIWHFLSALGLFFSFMILLSLDDDLIYTPRDRIPVF